MRRNSLPISTLPPARPLIHRSSIPYLLFRTRIGSASTRATFAGRSGLSRYITVATTKPARSEEHKSELQSLMRISYAVFCLKKKKNTNITYTSHTTQPSEHEQN